MNVHELFRIRPTNEEQNDFIITIGEHLATEKHFNTREEAEKYKDTPKWDMVIALVAEMFTIHEEVKHKEEERIKTHAKAVVKSIINNTIKEK